MAIFPPYPWFALFSPSSYDELPFSTSEYWKSLEDILANYVMRDDGKIDYIDGFASRKPIIV